MEKKLSRKNLAVSLMTLFAIVAIMLGTVFISGCKGWGKLNYDKERGNIAVEKVENAQYTPDIDKYLSTNSAQTASFAASDDENERVDEFTALIEEYATVQNYAGAGKYLGYDIYEIKNEIKFVVEMVPAFNQWFRMPTMREKQGFAAIPYYENWAYYLEMDEETSMLSITRVCWSTRSSYYDFEKGEEVEEYEDGSSFIQYEIMKTNYLETEEDEIVECFIYSVGIDNVKRSNYYNSNTQDYYPFEYQYLRNVKDKSMVKYHITAANRGRSGMDIRGLNPYGVRREFTVVNYDGYKDISVTKIDQKFATLEEPGNNGCVDFDIDDPNLNILFEATGYDGKIADLTPNEMMDGISKHIVDNFEIKNNWATIYKEQADAVEVKNIYGPFYGKDMWTNNVNVYVACRGHHQDEIEFSASADINDMSKFDLTKEYSLSMALKSRETGKIYIIATDYHKIEKVNYNGSNETYYRIYGANIDLDASSIAVDENGIYDVVCVLTAKENGEDVILFDTKEVGFLRQYYGLIIPDSVDSKGVTHKYSVRGVGGKLTITVTSGADVA
ncbi:MAG: hypothetical protein K2L70_06895 [Clostridia bacterium]|nr:hypothetical protein [Clostridia bacterium]